ncbi:hypothetical protein H4S03_002842 [Coemansia sp. S3946]|nr:hypothetical protein H4S03_002842 [Coemansia sp. S3946]
MNVYSLECQHMEQATYNELINGVAYRQIQNFCNSGMSWNDIHEHFLQYPNVTSLQTRWCWLKMMLEVQAGDSLSAEWTDAERELIKDLIDRHVQSATRSELVDIIKCELPTRLLSDIHLLSGQYIYELKTHRLHVDQMTRLQDLVVEYGKDWVRIGKEFGVLPSRARHNWIMYGGEAVQPLVESPPSLVTSSVQRQFDSSGAVDWTQVSLATGLGIRECYELSRYDVGKDSWQYNPDTFSPSMADRMTCCIKEHYPAPGPVNYRAVSNYMWVDMKDCIRMHSMLQGKFKWTVADYERAAALKSQGLTFKEVAQHLSPALCPKNVARALKRYSSPKSVQTWFTADKMEEISRLVDEYAGKYPVVEIVAKISEQIEIRNRRNYHYTVSRCIAAHPYYQHKLDSIDYTDLALRIAHGQMTVSLVAKELDVPHSALTNRLQTVNRKQYSPIWTDEEIHKLVDYMQTCNSKPDYGYFS